MVISASIACPQPPYPAAAACDEPLQLSQPLLDPREILQEKAHLQTIDLGQRQRLEPRDSPAGRERLGGQLPLQVVPSQDVLDPVHQLGLDLAGFLPQRGQLPVLLIRRAGNIDLPQAGDRLSRQERGPDSPTAAR